MRGRVFAVIGLGFDDAAANAIDQNHHADQPSRDIAGVGRKVDVCKQNRELGQGGPVTRKTLIFTRLFRDSAASKHIPGKACQAWLDLKRIANHPTPAIFPRLQP